MNALTIDPEFQRLIPLPRPEERLQLEENLVANGCRDPLVTWRGILIDGHNRYEICTRLKIKYRTVEMALASRAHVLLWIEENQLGRRNLDDDQRAVIGRSVEKRRAALAIQERGKASGRGHKKLEANVASNFKGERSRKSAAKAANVSEYKVREIREIEKKLGPKADEVLDQIRSGEKRIREVKTDIRRAERIEKIAALAAPPPLPQDRKYPVLLVDPPWKYEYVEADSRAIENQYPTMTLDQLCALAVPSICLGDSVLFLWTTNPKLVEALQVLTAWGFAYRTNMVWVKDKLGMGYYVRGQHELLLIAKRGELPVPEPFSRPSSVIQAPRGEHSEKPPLVYELIERMYPGLPKVELFARGAARNGWSTWGNQAEQSNVRLS